MNHVFEMFLIMISGFHELIYFITVVELRLIRHDLDHNWFKKILIDLLLNLDRLVGMLFLKHVLMVKD